MNQANQAGTYTRKPKTWQQIYDDSFKFWLGQHGFDYIMAANNASIEANTEAGN